MAGRILVTGASGFVGRALVPALAADGWLVRAAMRHTVPARGPDIEVAALPDLAHAIDWGTLLAGVDVVIYLAGIAHTGRGVSEQRYDRVNRAATAELAAAAAAAGIERLIFMSSISAQSSPASDHVLTEADEPLPTSAYGRSKLAAERAVVASGVPFAILRPVVIYGPGAKGNVRTMLRVARSAWPLPFASFNNRRSLLGIDNLIAAVRLAATSPAALGQTYVVADPTPVALAQISDRTARGHGAATETGSGSAAAVRHPARSVQPFGSVGPAGRVADRRPGQAHSPPAGNPSLIPAPVSLPWRAPSEVGGDIGRTRS